MYHHSKDGLIAVFKAAFLLDLCLDILCDSLGAGDLCELAHVVLGNF